ncbi:MAG TPA: hypothetical protein VEI26_07945 [Terriglobales bacterium]|nr:hypothetical protein [Terriglobales bacterium]
MSARTILVFVAPKRCDFCTEGKFAKAYACHPFVFLKGTPMEAHARQDWTACAACAELIDADKWQALTERTLHGLVKDHGAPYEDVPAVRSQMRDLLDAFRQNMIPEA